MMEANISVIPLARLTGIFEEKIPYRSHIRVPNAKREYIARDIPEVSFVLIVLMACGMNEAVVHAAATSPIIVVKFMKKVFLPG
jgi:hypothetical protein